MPNLPNRPASLPRGLASLALALAISMAAADASAQHFPKHAARNRAFYGDVYHERGYADSLGLRGHKKCENGGYYGPPQVYSRQYGTIYGYRVDQPFGPLRSRTPEGYAGNGE